MERQHSVFEQESYQVATAVFEGPLDLLLQLIEHAELDITKLALAQVTDQFLRYIRSMEEKPVEEVSAFLVIAARLMQIKSEMLLPRPPEREPGEEDPADQLVQQLIVYKRYKEISTILADREERGLKSYLRLAPPPKVEGKLDLSDVGLIDLVGAALEAFAKGIEYAPLDTVVRAPRVSIRDRIRHITNELRKKGRTSFLGLLGKNRTRTEAVVTFLALLELVKQFRIRAQQEELFGDIDLEPDEAWDEGGEFELEFVD